MKPTVPNFDEVINHFVDKLNFLHKLTFLLVIKQHKICRWVFVYLWRSSCFCLALVSFGFTGEQTGLSGSLLELLLQLKRPVAGVPDVLTGGARQARVRCLHQRHSAGHWLHPNLTPCREIHWAMHPGWRWRLRQNHCYGLMKKKLFHALAILCNVSSQVSNHQRRLHAVVLRDAFICNAFN